MSGLEIIDVISRIVHVSLAITLAGGSVFLALMVMPAASELSEAEHDAFRGRLVGRWRRVVHPGIALLLLSGIWNLHRAMAHHQGDALYHALLGVKMLLALVVFFLAAALVGRSKKLEPIRANRARWLRVVVVLAAVIVGISGFVKVRGPVDSVSPEAPVENTTDQ